MFKVTLGEQAVAMALYKVKVTQVTHVLIVHEEEGNYIKVRLNRQRLNDTRVLQGRSDGGYICIYTPKISPSKFLWGKNDVRTAIQQFYTPKKLLYPQNKFLATPLVC